MLSRREKLEMLKDAQNPKRKDAFRQSKVTDPIPSFEAYINFLNGVHKAFSRQTASSINALSSQKFQL